MAAHPVFDTAASEYDAWYGEKAALYRQELDAVRRLLPGFSRGLEVGAGTGRFGSVLGVRTGVEPSPAMAEYASARGMEIVSGTAEALPFSDQEFDLLLMVTVVSFFADAGAAFHEAFRVLMSGGHLVAAFIDRETDLGREYLEKQSGNPFYRNARFFSAEEIRGLFTETGFDSLEAVQTLLPGRDTLLPGTGEGGFAVIRGRRP